MALVILPMSSVLVLAFVSIVFMSLSLKISLKELNVKYFTSLSYIVSYTSDGDEVGLSDHKLALEHSNVMIRWQLNHILDYIPLTIQPAVTLT